MLETTSFAGWSGVANKQTEGTAEWSAAGFECRGDRKVRGSIPLPLRQNNSAGSITVFALG